MVAFVLALSFFFRSFPLVKDESLSNYLFFSSSISFPYLLSCQPSVGKPHILPLPHISLSEMKSRGSRVLAEPLDATVLREAQCLGARCLCVRVFFYPLMQLSWHLTKGSGVCRPLCACIHVFPFVRVCTSVYTCACMWH